MKGAVVSKPTKRNIDRTMPIGLTATGSTGSIREIMATAAVSPEVARPSAPTITWHDATRTVSLRGASAVVHEPRCARSANPGSQSNHHAVTARVACHYRRISAWNISQSRFDIQRQQGSSSSLLQVPCLWLCGVIFWSSNRPADVADDWGAKWLTRKFSPLFKRFLRQIRQAILSSQRQGLRRTS